MLPHKRQRIGAVDKALHTDQPLTGQDRAVELRKEERVTGKRQRQMRRGIHTPLTSAAGPAPSKHPLRTIKQKQAMTRHMDPTLIDQVLAASFAKAPEIRLPRAPNVFGRAPRLDRRPQLRARSQPIETLGAKLKLR